MPEKDLRDIRTAILALPEDKQWEWARAFGTGDRKDIRSILAQINTPSIERAACERLKQVHGIEIMTEAERKEYREEEARQLLRRNVEANEKLAAEAERRRLAETVEKQQGGPVTELHVFVSWSSSKSHQVAKALKEWLPKVLPEAKPWVSSLDIRKGKPWFAAISDQLAKSLAGIICVTPENVSAPWIYYEAGAIAQALADPQCVVCSYLVGVSAGELAKTPLGQLQLTAANKDDTWLMIQSLNLCLTTPHSEKLLKPTFNSKWPSLQKKLEKIVGSATPPAAPPPPSPPPTPLYDLAQRILLAAAAGKNQTIRMNEDMRNGFSLRAGEETICVTRDAQEEAKGRAAVEELERRGMIRDRGNQREVFVLTDRGHGFVETVQANAAPHVPAGPALTDDKDILVVMQGWLAKKMRGTRTQPITFAEVDKEMNLQPGTSARLLEQAANNMGWVADAKGPSVIKFRHGRVLPR
jgi:hypothetical protein